MFKWCMICFTIFFGTLIFSTIQFFFFIMNEWFPDYEYYLSYLTICGISSRQLTISSAITDILLTAATSSVSRSSSAKDSQDFALPFSMVFTKLTDSRSPTSCCLDFNLVKWCHCCEVNNGLCC